MGQLTIAKTAFKKIWALIHSINFFLLRLLCNLYKSTIQLCMEYYCHAWACYFELLDKLQKWICSTVGASLGSCLEHLGHHQNVVSWSLFYRYYFGRCSSELAQLVPLPYSGARKVIFLSPFLDATRMPMSTVSFFSHLD